MQNRLYFVFGRKYNETCASGLFKRQEASYADVAELADALDSGFGAATI
jgi:hypothetical protein